MIPPMIRRSTLVALALFVWAGSLGTAPAGFAQEPPAAPAWEPIPVSGRVVDDDGAPRPGLAVRLERAPLPGSVTPEPVDAETDDLGIFRARVVEPGYWRVVLRPDPEGEPVSVTLPYQPVVEPVDLGDLVAGEPTPGWGPLHPGGLLPDAPPEAEGEPLPPLSVRLVDRETGRPVVGALARYFPGPGLWARSDVQGVLALPSLPPDPERRLLVHAAGRQTIHPRLAGLEPGGDLPLDTTALVSGHAVDGAGNPLADVRVGTEVRLFGEMLPRPTVRTGPDGAFALSLANGTRIEGLLARHPERAPARLAVTDLSDGERRSGLVVVVPGGVDVSGVVVDPVGAPVTGADVRIFEAGDLLRLAAPIAEAETDADGRFTAERLPTGRYELSVRAAGYPTTRRRNLELTDPGSAPSRIDLGVITLEAGTRIAGLVTDPTGRPLEGVSIRSLQVRSRFPSPLLAGDDDRLPTVRTDAEGRFELTELPAGLPIRLIATRDGHLPVQTSVTATAPGAADPVGTDDDPVILVLEPAAFVVGRVETPAGEPVSGARIWTQPVEGRASPLTDDLGREIVLTDDDGLFELIRLAPGRVDIHVQAAGWAETRETITAVVGREPEPLILTLEPGVSLTGRVTDDTGRPLEWTEVTVRPLGDDPGWSNLLRADHVERTGDDGTFAFATLTAGEHTIRVRHEEWSPVELEITLSPGGNHRDIQLTERGRSVAGHVVTEDGGPVAGATIFVRVPDSQSNSRPLVSGSPLRTAGDGSFVAQGLPAVPVTLSVHVEDTAVRQEVDLAGGSVDDLEIVVGGGGRIVGRVVGVEGPRLADVEILAIGPAFQRPTVSEDGAFVVDSATPGEWRVMAALPDGRSVSEHVVVAGEGDEISVELDLTPGEIDVDGLLLVNGEPRGGLSVRVEQSGSPHAVAQTDYGGRFRLGGLRPGPHQLTVTSSRGVLHVEEVSLTSSGGLTVEVETVTVAGSVVDPTTGQPVPEIRVQLIRQAAFDRTTDPQLLLAGGVGDRTDELGRFEIGPVGAEAFRLVVGDQEPTEGQLLDLSSGLDVVGLVVAPPGR